MISGLETHIIVVVELGFFFLFIYFTYVVCYLKKMSLIIGFFWVMSLVLSLMGYWNFYLDISGGGR